MKIRIDRDGWLEIERAGFMKLQECPYDVETEDCGRARCGDWCPLFGELEERHEPIYGDGIGPVNAIELSICKRVWRCKPDDFEDER